MLLEFLTKVYSLLDQVIDLQSIFNIMIIESIKNREHFFKTLLQLCSVNCIVVIANFKAYEKFSINYITKLMFINILDYK